MNNLPAWLHALAQQAGQLPAARDAQPSMLQNFIRGAIASIVYSVIGIVMFAIAFVIINKVVPFSIRKEIEEDQNISLGIVIGSVFIGIAMILSAAIRG